MNDPLAHLYAETGVDDVELPVRETSFDELHAVRAEEEHLSDSDVAELVVLLRGKYPTQPVPATEMVELGLADFNEGGPCEWYALCDQEAAGTVDHPALGAVPTCHRCAKKHELELVREISLTPDGRRVLAELEQEVANHG